MAKRKKKKRRVKKRKIKKRKLKKRKKVKKIKSEKSNNSIFKVSAKWARRAYVDKSEYEKKYKLSIRDNEGFWKKKEKELIG